MGEIKLKPCPFCGKRVIRTRGIGGLNFFKCINTTVCGAVISFDNDFYNRFTEMAVKAFNKRAGEGGVEE